MTTMPQTTQKSIPGIIALRIFGLLLFLFLLYIANNLSFFTDNPLNYQVILFLNSQVWLLVLITIAFLIGEIFNALIFPLNLPAPLFNAAGAVLLAGFLIRIFALFDILLDNNIFHFLDTLSFIIYPFVFIIVLIGGYILILQNLVRTDQSPKKETKTIQDTAATKTGEAITWEDVGDKFRQAVYDLLILLRSSIKK
jgi:hypothetical protein